MNATAAEDAARIRKTLKGCGITSRQVSVRARSYSLGSSIDINIHDPAVDIREVKNVAAAAERIHYCHASGEILGGANRFLNVEYSSRAAAALVAQQGEMIAAILDAATKVGPHEWLTVGDLMVGRDGHQHLITPAQGIGPRAWMPDPKIAKPEHVAAAILSIRGAR